jgi:UDP-N-acetyl-D-galactosamine dehydrogenase
MIEAPEEGAYDAIILAVAHQEFRDLGLEGVRRLGRSGAVLFDVKAVLPKNAVDGRL